MATALKRDVKISELRLAWFIWSNKFIACQLVPGRNHEKKRDENSLLKAIINSIIEQYRNYKQPSCSFNRTLVISASEFFLIVSKRMLSPDAPDINIKVFNSTITYQLEVNNCYDEGLTLASFLKFAATVVDLPFNVNFQLRINNLTCPPTQHNRFL